MSRKKPRYTPDPPPYNATQEQFLAWANTQFQRIEDYWPRDDGERVTALEELQQSFSGEWVVDGSSFIRFEGYITQTTYPWVCENFIVSSSVHEHDDRAALESGWWAYSDETGKLYFSSAGTGLLEIDPTLLTIVERKSSGALGGTNDTHPIAKYTYSGTDYILWNYYVSGTWTVQTLRASDFQLIRTTSLGQNITAYHWGDESDDIIVAYSSNALNGRLIFCSKANIGNYALDDVVVNNSSILCGVADSANNVFHYVGLPTSTTARLYKYTVSDGAPPTLTDNQVAVGAEQDITTYGANLAFKGKLLRVPFRNGIWWLPCSDSTLGSEKIGMIGLSASTGELTGPPIWFDENATAIGWNAQNDKSSGFYFDSHAPIMFDGTIDKFYYTISNKICRYDPESGVIECCEITPTNDWDTGLALQASIYPLGNYIFAYDKDGATPETLNYATIIARVQVYSD